MKKIVAVLASLVVAASIFAVDAKLGVGGGGSMIKGTSTLTTEVLGISSETSIDNFVGGFNAFVDANYLVLEVGVENMFSYVGSIGAAEATSVSVGVLGKYPIKLGLVTLFPLIGGEMVMPIYTEEWDSGEPIHEELKAKFVTNQIFLEAGLGADINIGSFFIRPSVLYAHKLENDFDKFLTQIPGSTLKHFNFKYSIQAGFWLF